MSRDEAIRALLEQPDQTELIEKIGNIEIMLELILSAIVIPQKDAGEIAGISVNTIRNKVLRGELDVLSANGSKLNYLTLKQTGDLKPQRKPKRRK